MKKIDLARFVRPILGIIIIYVVILLGPIAGFDVPAVATNIRSDPKQVLQYLIIGLANGSIIAIIALGYKWFTASLS